ncbi:MAG: MFS transporter [Candidatus Magasanikbacteria bacterium]|nr:MFS transporter [Candidatus Magasanikbacteria bacterium]
MALKLTRNDITLGLVSMLNDISSEMIFPMLPFFMVAVLGLSKGEIGIVEGIAGGAASFFLGLSGYLSDRLGRRKDFVVFGYSLSVITKPLFAMASTGWQAIFLRFFDRAGKGFRESPRDALIAAGQDQRHRGRAFGFNRTMDTIGGSLGSLFVFWWLLNHANDYRTIFWISFFPGVFAVLLLILFVKEKRAGVSLDGGETPRRRFSWEKLGKHSKLFYIVTTIFALANASYAFFLLKAEKVGIAKEFAPLLYMIYTLVSAFLFVPIGKWTDHKGRKLSLLLGYFLFSLTALGFALASDGIVWVLFVLYGAGLALTDGVSRAFLSDLVHPDVRATALGIYYGLNGLALFISSVVFGYLWDKFGENLPFIVSSIVAACAGFVFIFFIVRHRNCKHFGEAAPHINQ